MPIYKMVMEKARWEGISLLAFMSVLTLEGKCLCWRAKPAHLGGHLPAVIGDNGLKEVQKGALVDGFILTDLNRPCCQVPLSLVNNALGIGHDGVVDENGEMILRCEQRAYVAIQRKIGLLGALDGLGHVRVGGVHQISHLAAHLLLPARESMNVVVDAGVGLVCTHGMMIPRIKVLTLCVSFSWSSCSQCCRLTMYHL